MNKHSLLFFIAILSCACTAKKSFTIDGSIYGDVPKYIYLTYNNKRDSTEIINNKFFFKGKVDRPTKGNFALAGVSSVNKSIYIDNHFLYTGLTNTLKKYKKSGIEINVNYINIDTVFGNKLSSIQSAFENFTKNNKEKNNWNALVYEKLDELIKVNPRNVFLGDELYYLSISKTLTPIQMKRLFSKLDSTYVSEESTNGIWEYISPIKKMTIGNSMFNFVLPTPNKTTINTTQYRGHYLFIHFWASWCAPCRKDNIELNKMYKKYKKNQFFILNVSTDTELNKWKKAIVEDGISWDNVVDVRKSKSTVLTKYDAVSSIPKSYLIDPKGLVIMVNPSMETLNTRLSKLYNK